MATATRGDGGGDDNIGRTEEEQRQKQLLPPTPTHRTSGMERARRIGGEALASSGECGGEGGVERVAAAPCAAADPAANAAPGSDSAADELWVCIAAASLERACVGAVLE